MSTQFPHGKLSPDDAGELELKIGADLQNKVVIIAFKRPTYWVAFERDYALELANSILKYAEEIKERP